MQRALTLSPCPQGLLLRQLHHMPQVCPAHLAEAVAFPGAWDRHGRLEWWAPLPGLSGDHPTGHRQSQAISCALETPRMQHLDLSPRAGPEWYKCHELRHLWVLVGTWSCAISWMCCCEGQNVPRPPHCRALWAGEWERASRFAHGTKATLGTMESFRRMAGKTQGCQLQTPSLGLSFVFYGWFGIYPQAPSPPAPCLCGVFWISLARALYNCPQGFGD